MDGGGSAPPPPDPVATANAQGTANAGAARLTTALNRPNQVTPYGSLTWTHGGGAAPAPAPAPGTPPAAGSPVTASTPAQFDPAAWSQTVGTDSSGAGFGAAGVAGQAAAHAPATSTDGQYGTGLTPDDNWTSTITLDPRIQNILDSQLGIQQGLNSATQHQLGDVNNQFAKPIDYSALPGAGSAAGAQGAAMTRYANLAPDVARTQATAGLAGGVANQGIQEIGQIAGSPLPDASEAARQQVINSMYGQATSRLDPQYQQQEAQMRSDLMNRGIVEGSDAWNTEMGNLSRQKNDAYTSAMNSAIQGGGAEQSRLLSNQLSVRSQGMQEGSTAMGAGSQANADLRGMAGQQGTINGQIDQSAQTQFGMQNTQRQDALTEQQQARANAINQLTALMSGQQTQSPQFSSGMSGTSVQAAPIAQLAQNQYQGQLGAYNADVSSSNAQTGAVASMAATAAMVF